jgi:hypothetical protein
VHRVLLVRFEGLYLSKSQFYLDHNLEKVVGSSTVLGWMRNSRNMVHFDLDEVGMTLGQYRPGLSTSFSSDSEMNIRASRRQRTNEERGTNEVMSGWKRGHEEWRLRGHILPIVEKCRPFWMTEPHNRNFQSLPPGRRLRRHASCNLLAPLPFYESLAPLFLLSLIISLSLLPLLPSPAPSLSCGSSTLFR